MFPVLELRREHFRGSSTGPVKPTIRISGPLRDFCSILPVVAATVAAGSCSRSLAPGLDDFKRSVERGSQHVRVTRDAMGLADRFGFVAGHVNEGLVTLSDWHPRYRSADNFAGGGEPTGVSENPPLKPSANVSVYSVATPVTWVPPCPSGQPSDQRDPADGVNGAAHVEEDQTAWRSGSHDGEHGIGAGLDHQDITFHLVGST